MFRPRSKVGLCSTADAQTFPINETFTAEETCIGSTLTGCVSARENFSPVQDLQVNDNAKRHRCESNRFEPSMYTVCRPASHFGCCSKNSTSTSSAKSEPERRQAVDFGHRGITIALARPPCRYITMPGPRQPTARSVTRTDSRHRQRRACRN